MGLGPVAFCRYYDSGKLTSRIYGVIEERPCGQNLRHGPYKFPYPEAATVVPSFRTSQSLSQLPAHPLQDRELGDVPLDIHSPGDHLIAKEGPCLLFGNSLG